ncbi:SixA phosphatase family protein [Lentibacter sp. XHP0401]|jgi:phosphohistidine phosphatase|uniref:SixA phosphatase family protein n=1 Tax=Lentibacter sp. XHP0401 TaxID=2984334 RepID=UPI0021E82CC0|nr:histidine phosphatase family protein [Lentibacter sp. XHP0401]MCV2892842.1 histidine phosphatase family protein [Lentibacter sp. XHP0401]
MSLRLILMRHAKSSWDDLSLPDHDRPLSPRGQRSADAIGAWLKDNNYMPDQVLCSSSARTRETFERLGLALEPIFLPSLYHASEDRMLQLLQYQAKGSCVLLLGHNPGAAFFAESIVAKAPQDEAFALFPTAATLVVDFNCDTWADLRFGQGEFHDFVVPRALMD